METGEISLSGGKGLVFVKALSSFGDGQISLKAGDIIQARVVAVSQDSTILNIGGARISASTNVSLNPGEQVSFRIVEVNPERIVLKHLTDQGLVQAIPRHTKDELIKYLLSRIGIKADDFQNLVSILKETKISIGKEFAELKSLIASLASNASSSGEIDLSGLLNEIDGLTARLEDKQAIVTALKAFAEAISHEARLLEYLEGSGPNVGSNIKNIKAGLLQSHALLQGHEQFASDGSLSAMKAAVEKLLDLLSSTTVLNLPNESQARNFIYLPLPVRLGDEVRTADIRIYADRPGGKKRLGRSSYSVAFALDMPSLGKTRAWLEVIERSISFSITTENVLGIKEAKDLFKDLKCSFEDMGYKVGRFKAAEIKKDTPSSLIEEKVGLKLEGIDLRA
ncbi:MAG: hypothetical protein K6T91_01245 [Firmicutes bacterium]|nr:hypothetical protein [Bacillota bacterium]